VPKHPLSRIPLLLAFALSQAFAQTPVADGAAAEKMLRDSLQLPANYKLVVLDEKGIPLAFDLVAGKMQSGAAMDVQRDDTAKTVTLRVQRKPEVGEGAMLPAFDLQDIHNRRLRNLDLAGRPTLINFFFETCVPCIKEAPVLSMYRLKHREFNYLAVTPDTKEEAKRFVLQRKLDWPVAYEGDAFIEAMKITGFPTYLLVGSDGKIIARGQGMDPRSMDDPTRALGEFEKWVSDHLKR